MDGQRIGKIAGIDGRVGVAVIDDGQQLLARGQAPVIRSAQPLGVNGTALVFDSRTFTHVEPPGAHPWYASVRTFIRVIPGIGLIRPAITARTLDLPDKAGHVVDSRSLGS